MISQKPKATTKMSSRQRPLHACGVSIIAIADIAYGKTQDINGPLGSYLRRVAKLAKFATPLIYAMRCQWLAILSFMDDHIIAAEKMAEKVFPLSTYVFDKVDELVLVIASMPEKFDGAVNKFPAMIHKLPLPEWALTRFISSLNSLVSTLDHWGHEDSSTKEKTIGVDSSSSRCNPMDSLESFPPISEAENKGVHDKAVSSHMKGSYKEALERGKEGNQHEKKVDGGELCEVSEGGEKDDGSDEEESEGVGKFQIERSESTKGGDLILKLFDAWLMNPGRF